MAAMRTSSGERIAHGLDIRAVADHYVTNADVHYPALRLGFVTLGPR
jgi:hypothetical protein